MAPSHQKTNGAAPKDNKVHQVAAGRVTKAKKPVPTNEFTRTAQMVSEYLSESKAARRQASQRPVAPRAGPVKKLAPMEAPESPSSLKAVPGKSQNVVLPEPTILADVGSATKKAAAASPKSPTSGRGAIKPTAAKSAPSAAAAKQPINKVQSGRIEKASSVAKPKLASAQMIAEMQKQQQKGRGQAAPLASIDKASAPKPKSNAPSAATKTASAAGSRKRAADEPAEDEREVKRLRAASPPSTIRRPTRAMPASKKPAVQAGAAAAAPRHRVGGDHREYFPDLRIVTPQGQVRPTTKIGLGRNAIVFRARMTLSSGKERLVAAKFPANRFALLENAKTLLPLWQTEIAVNELIAKKKDVQHLVKALDMSDDPEHDQGLFLVMEQMDGSLADLIKQHRGQLPPALVYDMTVQVAEGLMELQKLGYVHGDLKPQDILYKSVVDNKETKLVWKIADFGMAQKVGQNTLPRHINRFRAPEAIKTGVYAKSTDVWSLYCILALAMQWGKHVDVGDGKALAKMGAGSGWEAWWKQVEIMHVGDKEGGLKTWQQMARVDTVGRFEPGDVLRMLRIRGSL